MGLTKQEKQDRLWKKAVDLRDKADKERAFNDMLEALKAIKARIEGEWDNPSLIKFGALSVSVERDIYTIVMQIIDKK